MKKLALLLCVCAGFTFISTAQDSERPRKIGNKWAVKLTPTQMVMGELNLGLEFKVANKSSIDIEFGPTIARLGLGGMTEDDWFNDSTSALNYDGGIGYFAALGFRYYPFEKTSAMNRLYIHPQLKYRVYNTTVSEDSGLWGDAKAVNTQYKFFINVGWQLWASKSFLFDFYLGAGMGYRQHDVYEPISFTGSNGIEYYWQNDRQSTPQLLLNFGIKLGIGGGGTK